MGLNVANIVLISKALKKSHMVPVLSRSREFSLFLDGTGTGTGKNWSREKVPVPVSEKIGPGKKYRSRYRKNLVPEKSTGPGTGKNWSRKKVPVPVPEKILGTVTLCISFPFYEYCNNKIFSNHVCFRWPYAIRHSNGRF